MAGEHNRRRAFADVVSVDAWHEPFAGGVTHVDLHADVVFGKARVGSDDDAPVRFRLSVRRAEVVVVVPEHEPVQVVKASVSRDGPIMEGRVHQTKERHNRVGGSLRISAGGHLPPAALGAISLAGESQSTKVVESTVPLLSMLALQSRDADGNYRWLIESQETTFLAGRPWSASAPRMTLADRRIDKRRSLPPCVRVEVRCRREDLLIEDVEVKDEGIWIAAASKVGFVNRMAAAVSYLRMALADHGLGVGRIDDPFSQVVLASVLAEGE